MKKTTPKTNEYWRHKCVELAKKLAKKRDGYICQKCHKTGRAGYRMHGSHIFSEGAHHNLSSDLDNIICLCATCHAPGFKGSWHDDPAEGVAWLEEKFPGRLHLLREKERVGKNIKIDYQKRYLKLKEL